MVKSTVGTATAPAVPEFPRLMLGGSGCIYLMVDPLSGTRIYRPEGSANILGQYESNLVRLEPFHGTVTLES